MGAAKHLTLGSLPPQVAASRHVLMCQFTKPSRGCCQSSSLSLWSWWLCLAPPSFCGGDVIFTQAVTLHVGKLCKQFVELNGKHLCRASDALHAGCCSSPSPRTPSVAVCGWWHSTQERGKFCSKMLKKFSKASFFFQTALCKLLPGYNDCSLVQQSLETSDSPGQIQNIDKTPVIHLFINKDFGVPIMHQTQNDHCP